MGGFLWAGTVARVGTVCGDCTAGALHVHVCSCPAVYASYTCILWIPWAVQLKGSAQSAQLMRCRDPTDA